MGTAIFDIDFYLNIRHHVVICCAIFHIKEEESNGNQDYITVAPEFHQSITLFTPFDLPVCLYKVYILHIHSLFTYDLKLCM